MSFHGKFLVFLMTEARINESRLFFSTLFKGMNGKVHLVNHQLYFSFQATALQSFIP